MSVTPLWQSERHTSLGGPCLEEGRAHSHDGVLMFVESSFLNNISSALPASACESGSVYEVG